MRYLKIEYETDKINTKMESALNYLLKLFGYEIEQGNLQTPLCHSISYRLLIFRKKDE